MITSVSTHGAITENISVPEVTSVPLERPKHKPNTHTNTHTYTPLAWSPLKSETPRISQGFLLDHFTKVSRSETLLNSLCVQQRRVWGTKHDTMNLQGCWIQLEKLEAIVLIRCLGAFGMFWGVILCFFLLCQTHLVTGRINICSFYSLRWGLTFVQVFTGPGQYSWWCLHAATVLQQLPV